ncbi:hypothetical protein DRN34_00730 [Thermococci archaeon]|nr:MAG: hypothetical protein DRN34_00730 [Thermococci archaeon]
MAKGSPDWWLETLSDNLAKRFELLLFYTSSLANHLLAANSEYEWLSIAGSGFLFSAYHKSKNVPAFNSWCFYNLDDTGYYSGYFLVSVANAAYAGVDAKGFYSCGITGCRVSAWDTSTHEYIVLSHNIPLQFNSSLVAKIKNDHSTDTATITHTVMYRLYVSSKPIKLKPKRHLSKYTSLIRQVLKHRFKACSAVIFDHYVVNPDEPEEHQHSAPRLIVIMPDAIYEREFDKIVSFLIKEDVATDIIEKKIKEHHAKNIRFF